MICKTKINVEKIRQVSGKRFRLGDNNTEPGVIGSNLKLKSSDEFMWIGSDLDQEYWHIGCNCNIWFLARETECW